ncbi:hypothetical protein WMY93_004575 [Mugilogobius chulae]|uniref:glutathione transferase n=1 Tax=Mugilogobius chulae TaxID=88201 RepID=A0AAW0PXG3_9GOBI
METNTSQVCGEESQVCGEESQVCGEESQVCGEESQVCGEESQVCGEESQVCGEESQVCGEESQVCGEESQVCGEESQVCGEESQVCGESGLWRGESGLWRGESGLWRVRSVERRVRSVERRVRSVESQVCGESGLWRVRSVESQFSFSPAGGRHAPDCPCPCACVRTRKSVSCLQFNPLQPASDPLLTRFTMLELYADLLSQPCRAVRILLQCTGTAHALRTVALRKGEHQTEDFSKLNPMRKVPVLVDDGFVLTESDAILKYLVSRCSLADHWYPKNPQRRARVDEYTAWHQSNTRPHAAKVFILEVLIPAQTRSPVDSQVLNRSLQTLDQTLDKLESMFLRRQAFLCGSDVSIADLLCVCELMQPVGGDRDVLESRPLLQRWRSRVQSAVGPAFDDAHSVLYAVRDRHRDQDRD